MSELVTPTNFSDAGRFTINRRFHAACAAGATSSTRRLALSKRTAPARSPTRGSGLGGTVDRLAAPDEAHAVRERPAMTRASARNRRFMVSSGEGGSLGCGEQEIGDHALH